MWILLRPSSSKQPDHKDTRYFWKTDCRWHKQQNQQVYQFFAEERLNFWPSWFIFLFEEWSWSWKCTSSVPLTNNHSKFAMFTFGQLKERNTNQTVLQEPMCSYWNPKFMKYMNVFWSTMILAMNFPLLLYYLWEFLLGLYSVWSFS